MRLGIVGGKGNMGRRYVAICKSENIPYEVIDKDDQPKLCSHYLITTPTRTHEKVLDDLCLFLGDSKAKAKILMEKPVALVSNLREDLKFIDRAKGAGHEIYMVNQYAYYSHQLDDTDGPTYYDFYHSGGDGLQWDCIQLIYLARSGVQYLKNESPVWKARINGVPLSRELIDLCYVKMLKDFVSDGAMYGELWNHIDIKRAHKAVLEYERGFNRYTGKVDVDPSP